MNMFFDQAMLNSMNEVIAGKHDVLHNCEACKMIRSTVTYDFPENELDMLDFYLYVTDGTWKNGNRTP